MNLLNLSRNELEAFFLDLGEKRFRAEQVYQWIWAKRAGSFEEMTNLSKELRGKLVRKASLFRPRPVQVKASKDGTVKFLLELEDRALVESVLIPGEGRYTQCLSTQVGCAMGCTFCATGTMGLTRNMTAGEIMSQILVGRDYLADKGLSPLKNLVFMGMGEPLDNLDQVIRALEGIRDPGGLNISNRRMTVSTVGLPGPLERLGTTGLALPAVSLHAPTQQLRARIMPKAARVPLDELLGVLKNYPLRPRERITFEYLLLGGGERLPGPRPETGQCPQPPALQGQPHRLQPFGQGALPQADPTAGSGI